MSVHGMARRCFCPSRGLRLASAPEPRSTSEAGYIDVRPQADISTKPLARHGWTIQWSNAAPSEVRLSTSALPLSADETRQLAEDRWATNRHRQAAENVCLFSHRPASQCLFSRSAPTAEPKRLFGLGLPAAPASDRPSSKHYKFRARPADSSARRRLQLRRSKES